MPAEFDSPQKRLKFLHCAGLRKVPHSCQLLGDGGHAAGSHLEAQELHLRAKKLALRLVVDQTVVLKVL